MILKSFEYIIYVCAAVLLLLCICTHSIGQTAAIIMILERKQIYGFNL